MDVQTPHLSASRLGRYLAANALGRKRLVEDAQRAAGFRWYTDAASALCDFLVGEANPSVLDVHVQRMLATSLDEASAHRVKLCCEALDAFTRALPTLGLEGMSFDVLAAPPPPLHLGRVEVDVAPHLATQQRRRGVLRQGLLRFYFSKHEPLDETAATYTTTLLRHAAESLTPGRVHAQLVLLVDVFAGRVFHAPVATAQRLRHLEVACEEVAARWN